MDGKAHLSWECDAYTASELYARRFEGRCGAMLLSRQTELIRRALGDISGGKVLELGAGHGQCSGLLLDMGAKLVAYGSPGSLEKLKRDLAGRESTQFVTGPLCPLPFPDMEFDAVVTVRTFSHVPHWKPFLRELCRVSKSMVVFDFAPGGGIMKRVMLALKKRFETGTRDYTVQAPRDIIEAAAKEGFGVRLLERQFFLPMLFHRVAGCGLFMPVEYAARAATLTGFAGGPGLLCLERTRHG